LQFADARTPVSLVRDLKDSDVTSSDSVITIEPGKTKKINIVFTAGAERGIQTGKLILQYSLAGTNAYSTLEIPVVLEVKVLAKLFDISLSIPALFKKVFAKSTLRAQVDLLNVGTSDELRDVTIDYIIKDFDNNILHKESETIAVGKSKSYLKSIELPELKPGKYVLTTELVYGGEYAFASNTFEVVTTGILPALMQKPEYLAGLAGLVIILIVLQNVYVIRSAKNRRIVNRVKKKSRSLRR